jgi:hypothetical protein
MMILCQRSVKEWGVPFGISLAVSAGFQFRSRLGSL